MSTKNDTAFLGINLPSNFIRRSLLGVSGDAKTVKGESFGFLTGILYLAPLDLGGFGNVCPFASKGCAADCLNSAGRGAFNSTQKARREKTALFFKANASFLCNLALDILKLQRKAVKLGLKPVVRLNGTSDIAWEKLKLNGFNLFQMFPAVSFYDYTKNPKRALDNAKSMHPKNYRVVFSRSETNEADCEKVLQAKGNVAVVFRNILPKRYLGKRVIVGDESDLRFLDPKGCVVGLTAKGKAKRSNSGFVVG
jgi:putative transposon-encoded protein